MGQAERQSHRTVGHAKGVSVVRELVKDWLPEVSVGWRDMGGMGLFGQPRQHDQPLKPWPRQGL